MSTLYIAATAFQLITILNIRVNMNAEKGDLILHEKSIPNSNYIKDRIIETKLFNRVFLFTDYDSRLNTIFTGKSSVSEYVKLIHKKHFSTIDINDFLIGEGRVELKDYDETFCFNKKFLDIIGKYDNIRINFIDEGVGSYTNGTINKANKINKIYLYKPELAVYYEKYKDKFCVVPVLDVQDIHFRNLLNEVWGYKDIVQFGNDSIIVFDQPWRITPEYFLKIPEFLRDNMLSKTKMYEKYINDEKAKNFLVKIVKRLHIKDSNITIKMHPRSSQLMKNFYKENGLNVLENTTIPWEIVFLNLNIDKICLLSMFSTVTLGIGIYFNNPNIRYTSLFLYKLASKENGVVIPREIASFLEGISEKLPNVKIPVDNKFLFGE